MPSQNVHPLWIGLEPLPKILHIFLGQLGVTELNHVVFAFGHLNPTKCIKCPNNHKQKCLLLEIFQIVASVSCMIFGSA